MPSKVSRQLALSVWNTHVSPELKAANCPMRCGRQIAINQFEVAYIIAKKNGGATVIDNLTPVCKQCKNSIGSLNVIDYIRLYKPILLSELSRLAELVKANTSIDSIVVDNNQYDLATVIKGIPEFSSVLAVIANYLGKNGSAIVVYNADEHLVEFLESFPDVYITKVCSDIDIFKGSNRNTIYYSEELPQIDYFKHYMQFDRLIPIDAIEVTVDEYDLPKAPIKFTKLVESFAEDEVDKRSIEELRNWIVRDWTILMNFW
jgi:hypothetical protein